MEEKTEVPKIIKTREFILILFIKKFYKVQLKKNYYLQII